MKKRTSIFVSALLCFLMLFSASAETIRVPIDLKSMTTEDLQLLADEINKEISTRKNDVASMEPQTDKGSVADTDNTVNETGEKAEDDGRKILLDQNDILIYIDGKARIGEAWVGSTECSKVLIIPIIIENNSNYTITPSLDDVSVNGWNTDGGSDVTSIDGVRYKTKAKSNLKFNLDKTDIKGIKDFSTLEFVFEVYNTDNWMGKKVIEKSKLVTISLDDIQ